MADCIRHLELAPKQPKTDLGTVRGTPKPKKGKAKRSIKIKSNVVPMANTPQPRSSLFQNTQSELGKLNIPFSSEVTAKAQPPKYLDGEEKLLRRFYEPLVLLSVLDSVRGPQLGREPLVLPGPDTLGTAELSREFVNQVAYICDFKTGGDTVTACALESTPATVIIWLAANRAIGAKVIDFLRHILENLRGMSDASVERRQVSEQSLFSNIVRFGIQRAKTYQRFLRGPLERTIKVLRQSRNGFDEDLADWLHSLQDLELLELCRMCYQERNSRFVQELARRSTPNADHFLQTRHYIGRLGSYLKATKILLTAGCKLPALFDSFEIKICEYLPSVSPPVPENELSLDRMLGRMLPAHTALEEVLQYQEALAFMDQKFRLLDQVKEQYRNKTFKPRVHAELILLEHFHRHNLEFVNRDKYIGCSKPACYCCYLYIRAHPGDFVHPACHNKLYTKWAPPGTDLQLRRNMLNEIVKPIRREVLRQISERRGPGNGHPDSTTGITASVDLGGGGR
ncbi:MAG: hypothetical protein M1817_004735 [Caeruleum heppii]|nr:MAG: hypothetical protein M1817_004735 [Caeruleum heppii]